MRMIMAWIALTSGTMLAQSMLTSTEALSLRLSDPSLVVLHVGSAKDYEAGHIPGARLITLSDISVTGDNGLTLELPPLDNLLDSLGKLGIDNNSRVVIYPGTASVQSATRVWFTFDYLGLGDRASLLDGGLSLWRAEGRPISTETPAWEPKRLTAKSKPELVVDAAYVLSQLNSSSVRIVDARTHEFHSGVSAGNMPRAGRIPGAHHAPFPSFFEEDRRFKPKDLLRQLLALPANVTPVTYCHIGQQATVPYFVARYLGMQPRLYDGSFQDWSRRTELPVEVTATK